MTTKRMLLRRVLNPDWSSRSKHTEEKLGSRIAEQAPCAEQTESSPQPKDRPGVAQYYTQHVCMICII
jgi:hypothetical protein